MTNTPHELGDWSLEAALAYHEAMGFTRELALDYHGPGQDRVAFHKAL